jgi:hypothetical protein
VKNKLVLHIPSKIPFSASAGVTELDPDRIEVFCEDLTNDGGIFSGSGSSNQDDEEENGE